jgi:hypothetical protein
MKPLKRVMRVPPGECGEREGGSFQSRACVGVVSGGAACGRARFDAVDEEEMMQPLDIVQVACVKMRVVSSLVFETSL